MNKRWLVWLPLLGFAAWLVISEPSGEDHAPESAAIPPRSANASTQASSRVQQVPLERLIPRSELFPERTSKARRDLFAAVSWLPPVEPVSQASIAEAPPAPAFNYLGRQFDGQRWEVFLGLGDRTYIASAGAVLDDSYQVESIDASSVTVVDLRTSQSHTILTGDQR